MCHYNAKILQGSSFYYLSVSNIKIALIKKTAAWHQANQPINQAGFLINLIKLRQNLISI